MNQTSMSKKGQVVIPLEIRKKLNIKPSSKLQVSKQGNKVVMTVMPQIEDVYGMFKPKGKITKDKVKKAKENQLSKKFSK